MIHLVLLPGMDGTGDLFCRFTDALPDDMAVTILHYPPDVELDWEELTQHVARQLPQEEPFVLVAESFSGPIGILLAALEPVGLRGLILCASFCTTPLPFGTRWFGKRVWPRMFRRPLPPGILRRNFVGARPPEGLVEEVQEAVSMVAPSVMAQRVRLISKVDVREALAVVQVPVLYLEAKKDRLLGRRGMAQVRSALPGAGFALLDGPHLLLQWKPDESVAAILAFLDSVVGPSASIREQGLRR